MHKILLVEDDANIRDMIGDYFSSHGADDLKLVMAKDGLEGTGLIEEEDFDLAVLDIMLPGLDGFSLCRMLRRKSDVPIIFLTARGREEDIVYGYDLGCDDYIIKPFSIASLLGKIRAMLKRQEGSLCTDVMTCGMISLNPRTYRVLVDGQETELPPKEYEILYLLMKNKGNVCTREMILTRLWGYDYEGDERLLDNHVKKLRKLLGKGAGQVKTVFARGYKLVEP